MTREPSSPESDVEQILTPPTRDLGDGFTVRRALPSTQRRTIGPFVFFDQMGPAGLGIGAGLDVRPHPHIGLATLTYLFEGELLHRDSLGNVQLIRPSEVNWMIAGSGIVHSERTPAATRSMPSTLSGIQTWIGLPQREEQMAPQFMHHGAAELPQLEYPGVRLRLIAGTLEGARSPVQTLSPLVYADAELQPGSTLTLDTEHEERALFISVGTLEVERVSIEAGRMLVFRAGRRVLAHTRGGARVLLLGGAPLDGPRYVSWNFVASSREPIQRAAEDWRAGRRFGTVPGETDFIPLPETFSPPSNAPPASSVDHP